MILAEIKFASMFGIRGGDINIKKAVHFQFFLQINLYSSIIEHRFCLIFTADLSANDSPNYKHQITHIHLQHFRLNICLFIIYLYVLQNCFLLKNNLEMCNYFLPSILNSFSYCKHLKHCLEILFF